MFKFLLGILLIVPAVSIAQSNIFEKKVFCDATVKIITTLFEEYKEEPVWLGDEDKSTFSLFVNFENRSWTVIQFNDKQACVIDSGIGFQFKRNNSTLIQKNRSF